MNQNRHNFLNNYLRKLFFVYTHVFHTVEAVFSTPLYLFEVSL